MKVVHRVKWFTGEQTGRTDEGQRENALLMDRREGRFLRHCEEYNDSSVRNLERSGKIHIRELTRTIRSA